MRRDSKRGRKLGPQIETCHPKRPTSFIVNGAEWIIEHRNPKVTPELIDALAECDHTVQKILVSTDLPDRVFWPTLAHEIMHAVDWQTGARQLTDEARTKAVDVSEIYAYRCAWSFLMAWQSLK